MADPQKRDRRAYNSAYRSRPEVRVKTKEYNQSPEVRERVRGYYRKYHKTPKRIAQSKAYYEANKETIAGKRKAKRLAMKLEVFDAYGGRFCACCRIAIIDFLGVDHVNGCGGKVRSRTHNPKGYWQHSGYCFYLRLKREGYPPGFQVLCMNCNWGKRVNGGICPHLKAGMENV